MFLSTAFPQPGDPARAPYNLRLCEALAEEHELTVVSPVPWTTAPSAGRPPVRLACVRYPTFMYPPRIWRSTHAWCLWQSIRAAVHDSLEEGAPDAVISYWTWPDGAVAARVARTCGAPSVMLVGGSDVLVLAARAANRRRIARTLAQASAVVAVGEQLGRAVAALGVSPERIAVIRRGVDRGVFSPGSQAAARERLGVEHSDRLLLWVGRLARVKGPDLLLDALERVAPRDVPRWRCTIVGDGPLRSALTRRVARGALRERVSFMNGLGVTALADWYRASEALIVSSRSEGVPNVLYEAKSCGTPVVAVNVGDIADVLGADDHLVPAGDCDRLSAAIADALIAPPPQRAPLALPSWRDSAAALVELISRVRAASGGGAARPLSTIGPGATEIRRGSTASQA